ncbi:XdhC family protein [Isoptericola sp. b490]|uniref:XdhC family protein n=1 Tax=Actinotalea lenta TaxID=3064654 RepID=UPI0027133D2D|nr:XdhC family protein [Isoptericola sp. b490]MDO8119785.1 XdhC family protein [Isoptericola sp. b490]
MREILEALGSPVPCALVTVTRTLHSSPRPVGSSMVVRADGSIIGNVSAGCVDGDAVLTAEDVLAGGRPVVTRYGVSDETAMSVGLACGGEIDLVVSPGPAPALVDLLRGLEREEVGCALVTVVSPVALRGQHLAVGPQEVRGTTGAPALDSALAEQARALVECGRSGTVTVAPDDTQAEPVDAVVQVAVPAPRMLIFGAGAFAGPLVTAARLVGYRVTLCDARAAFATSARFPDADEVVVDWPHRYLAGTVLDSRTVLCSLVHDPKFEIPLLVAALRSPAGYVGALGSRRTHAERVAALRRAGLGEEEIARLRAPIGLDLGAASPEETAISVVAEVIAVRSGGTGRELRDTTGRIHGGST